MRCSVNFGIDRRSIDACDPRNLWAAAVWQHRIVLYDRQCPTPRRTARAGCSRVDSRTSSSSASSLQPSPPCCTSATSRNHGVNGWCGALMRRSKGLRVRLSTVSTCCSGWSSASTARRASALGTSLHHHSVRTFRPPSSTLLHLAPDPSHAHISDRSPATPCSRTQVHRQLHDHVLCRHLPALVLHADLQRTGGAV